MYRDNKKKHRSKEVGQEKHMRIQKTLSKNLEFTEETIEESMWRDQEFMYLPEEEILRGEDVELRIELNDPLVLHGEQRAEYLPKRKHEIKIIEVSEQSFIGKDNYIYSIGVLGWPCDIKAESGLQCSELRRPVDSKVSEVKVTHK